MNQFTLNMKTVPEAAIQFLLYKFSHGIVDHVYYYGAGHCADMLFRGSAAYLENGVKGSMEAAGEKAQELGEELSIFYTLLTYGTVLEKSLKLTHIESQEIVVGGGLYLLGHLPFMQTINGWMKLMMEPILWTVPEKILESVELEHIYQLSGLVGETVVGRGYNGFAGAYNKIHTLSHVVDFFEPTVDSAAEGHYGRWMQDMVAVVREEYDRHIEQPYTEIKDYVWAKGKEGADIVLDGASTLLHIDAQDWVY